MKDLEYRVPSPYYLRMSLEDREQCVKNFDDPFLTFNNMAVKLSESDEQLVCELNEAKDAMERQNNEFQETENTSQRENTEESYLDLQGTPAIGGIHRPIIHKWLQQHFVVQEDNSLCRGDIFSAYVSYCESCNISHCNPATFGKILRLVFPNVTTRRIGTRGNSKYHYCGIGVKPRVVQTLCQSERNSDQGNYNVDLSMSLIADRANILIEHSQELLPLLHNFPTCEDLGLQEDKHQQLSEFLNLTYRWHAIRILDCVIRAEFYQLKDIIWDFWKSVPVATLNVISSTRIVAAIERCDQIIYSAINSILIPQVLQPIPAGLMLTLKHFVQNLLYWLQEGLQTVPTIVKKTKIKACSQFKVSFMRQLQINHMSSTASMMIENTETRQCLLLTWHQLHDNTIEDFSDKDCYTQMQIKQYLMEFEDLLQNSCSLPQHLNWIENIVLCNMERITRLSQNSCQIRGELIRKFVLEWTFFSTQILKKMTFICPETLGPMQLLDMFYKDYILYLLERWDVHLLP